MFFCDTTLFCKSISRLTLRIHTGMNGRNGENGFNACCGGGGYGGGGGCMDVLHSRMHAHKFYHEKLDGYS